MSYLSSSSHTTMPQPFIRYEDIVKTRIDFFENLAKVKPNQLPISMGCWKIPVKKPVSTTYQRNSQNSSTNKYSKQEATTSQQSQPTHQSSPRSTVKSSFINRYSKTDSLFPSPPNSVNDISPVSSNVRSQSDNENNKENMNYTYGICVSTFSVSEEKKLYRNRNHKTGLLVMVGLVF